MNRKYTTKQFDEAVKILRNNFKQVHLTTDIIVGFPGETEEDFLDTLDVVRKVKFDQIFMFEYSRRKGTKADEMLEQIPDKMKTERLEMLKKLNIEIIEEINNRLIGTKHQILVEGRSKNNQDMYTGRTSQNKVVIFEAEDKDVGKIKNIEIISQHLWYLKGKITQI